MILIILLLHCFMDYYFLLCIRASLVEFLSSHVLIFMFLYCWKYKKNKQKTKKENQKKTTKNIRKPNKNVRKPPMPGCKSWSLKCEHWQCLDLFKKYWNPVGNNLAIVCWVFIKDWWCWFSYFCRFPVFSLFQEFRHFRGYALPF